MSDPKQDLLERFRNRKNAPPPDLEAAPQGAKDAKAQLLEAYRNRDATPEPANVAGGGEYADMYGFGMGPAQERTFVFGNSVANAATLGLMNAGIDAVERGVNALPDNEWTTPLKSPGYYPGGTPADYITAKDIRGELRQEYPLTGFAGDVVGYGAGAGQLIWKGGAKALAPVRQAIGNLGPTGKTMAEKGVRYGGRLLGLGGAGVAETAAYDATVGANNRGDIEGRSVGLGERAGMAANAVKNPFAWAALPAMSGLFRLGRKGLKGDFAPSGVDPLRRDVDQATAAVIAAVPVNDGSRVGKAMEGVENIIRDGLKRRGVDDVNARIATAYQNLAKVLPSDGDGATPFAVMIEREFADAPEVGEALRKFLLKTDLDGVGVTREFIERIQQTSRDRYTQLIEQSFGDLPRAQQLEIMQGNRELAGQVLNDIVEHADRYIPKESANTQVLMDFLLNQSDKNQLLDASWAYFATWDVDHFIKNKPYRAAQEYLSILKENMRDPKIPAKDVRGARSKVNYIEDLFSSPSKPEDALPGWREANDAYREAMEALDALGYRDAKGKPVSGGFGPDIKAASKTDEATEAAAARYAEMTPNAQTGATISTREVMTDQLRGVRRGGTDRQGNDVLGLRIQDLQNAGFWDALERVFQERGRQMREGVDAIMDQRQFAVDIDGRVNSKTFNKADAAATGADATVRGLPRAVTGGVSNNSALVDAVMVSNGLPPINMLMRRLPDAAKKLVMPNQQTVNQMAEILLATPQGGGPKQIPLQPVPTVTPRNRPRKPFWQYKGTNGQQLPPPFRNSQFSAAPEVSGAVAGGFGGSMTDLNQDGVIDQKDSLIGALMGAGGGASIRRLPPPRPTRAPAAAPTTEMGVPDPSKALASGLRFVDRTWKRITDPTNERFFTETLQKWGAANPERLQQGYYEALENQAQAAADIVRQARQSGVGGMRVLESYIRRRRQDLADTTPPPGVRSELEALEAALADQQARLDALGVNRPSAGTGQVSLDGVDVAGHQKSGRWGSPRSDPWADLNDPKVKAEVDALARALEDYDQTVNQVALLRQQVRRLEDFQRSQTGGNSPGRVNRASEGVTAVEDQLAYQINQDTGGGVSVRPRRDENGALMETRKVYPAETRTRRLASDARDPDGGTHLGYQRTEMETNIGPARIEVSDVTQDTAERITYPGQYPARGNETINPPLLPIDILNRNRTQNELLALALDPNRAQDASRLAQNGQTFGTHLNKARAILGTGVAAGVAAGVNNQLEKARDKERLEAQALAEKVSVYKYQNDEMPERAVDVKEMQLVLYSEGLLPEVIDRNGRDITFQAQVDGKFGHTTKEALRRYQKRHGLNVTGYFTRETVRHMQQKRAALSSQSTGPGRPAIPEGQAPAPVQ